MPLSLALGVRDKAAGRTLGALEGGGGTPPFPMHPCPPPPPPTHWTPTPTRQQKYNNARTAVGPGHAAARRTAPAARRAPRVEGERGWRAGTAGLHTAASSVDLEGSSGATPPRASRPRRDLRLPGGSQWGGPAKVHQDPHPHPYPPRQLEWGQVKSLKGECSPIRCCQCHAVVPPATASLELPRACVCL